MVSWKVLYTMCQNKQTKYKYVLMENRWTFISIFLKDFYNFQFYKAIEFFLTFNSSSSETRLRCPEHSSILRQSAAAHRISHPPTRGGPPEHLPFCFPGAHFHRMPTCLTKPEDRRRSQYLQSSRNSWKRNYQTKEGHNRTCLFVRSHLYGHKHKSEQLYWAFTCFEQETSLHPLEQKQVLSKEHYLRSLDESSYEENENTGVIWGCKQMLSNFEANYFSLQQWDYIYFIFVLFIYLRQKVQLHWAVVVHTFNPALKRQKRLFWPTYWVPESQGYTETLSKKKTKKTTVSSLISNTDVLNALNINKTPNLIDSLHNLSELYHQHLSKKETISTKKMCWLKENGTWSLTQHPKLNYFTLSLKSIFWLAWCFTKSYLPIVRSNNWTTHK